MTKAYEIEWGKSEILIRSTPRRCEGCGIDLPITLRADPDQWAHVVFGCRGQEKP